VLFSSVSGSRERIFLVLFFFFQKSSVKLFTPSVRGSRGKAQALPRSVRDSLVLSGTAWKRLSQGKHGRA
jgi:hypothetical protein